MATHDSDKSGQDAAPKKKGLVGWVAVGAVAGAAGVAAPVVMMNNDHSSTDKPKNSVVQYELLPPEQAKTLDFGEVTVNLNEARMNRYLRLKISLQIDKTQEQMVTLQLGKQNQVLRNWLISSLSDKQLDEVRGAAGQNMLRREIRDRFNDVLFSDGFDRIYDVLFDEFNVQ